VRQPRIPHFREPIVAAALERDGYVVVNCLARDEVEALTALWRAERSDLDGLPFAGSLMSKDVPHRLRVHAAIATILEPRSVALASDARFFYGNFVAKLPGEGSALPLHQDASCCDERRWPWWTIWVPLVDVDERNGALRVIPGSHRCDEGPRPFNAPFAVRIDPDEERALCRDVPMRAGQACLMAHSLVHGSPQNRSGAPRVAASGLLAHRSARLQYVHLDVFVQPPHVELYDVDDLFFSTFVEHGSRPPQAPRASEPLRALPPGAGRLRSLQPASGRSNL
jgi:hypothetical protein